MESVTSKDMRQRVNILLGTELPLVQFAGAYSAVARRLESLQAELPSDVFATAVCVQAASKFAAPLTETQRQLLLLFPDIDLDQLPVPDGASVDHLVDNLVQRGYVRTFPANNTLRAQYDMFLLSEKDAAYVSDFMQAAFSQFPLAFVKTCLRHFHNNPLVCHAVLTGATCVAPLKKPRSTAKLDSPPERVQVWLEQLEQQKHGGCGAMPPRKFDCAVCMDAVMGAGHDCGLACGSTVCDVCLFTYVHTELYEATKAVRKCVAPECAGVYGPDSLTRVLGLHYQKFLGVEASQVLDGAVFTCPCGNILSYSDGGQASAHCLLCNRNTCLACLEPAHGRIPCGNTARQELDEALSAVVVRVCPCGKRFVKEEGCNKMTCVCGRKMCYICRQAIHNYDHFCSCPHKERCPRCHIYTDADKRDAENLQAVGLQFPAFSK
jgi:hypothetical protein